VLILSRHKDERIMISDDIVITVLDIRGDKVRLGISAPIETPIHREEIYDEIKRLERQEGGAE
jgi:carbon storage regulator